MDADAKELGHERAPDRNKRLGLPRVKRNRTILRWQPLLPIESLAMARQGPATDMKIKDTTDVAEPNACAIARRYRPTPH